MTDRKSIEKVHTGETIGHFERKHDGSPVTLYRTYSEDKARAIERALLRKIDTRILPVVVLIYILNYVSLLGDLVSSPLIPP